MKPGQKGIFYIAADSLAAAAGAPFVERLVQKGYEVLYLTEPIDEPALNAVGQFSGHDFVDVTREGLELGDGEEEKAEREAAAEAEKGELAPLLAAIASALGPERVERASVSTRLANSPCALVTSKFGWSAYQERVMRAQTLGDSRAAEYMKGKKTFEVNPSHRTEAVEAKKREILSLPFETREIGGRTMRVYSSDLGFAAAYWAGEPCAAVQSKGYVCVGSQGTPLVELGVTLSKTISPQFGLIFGA